MTAAIAAAGVYEDKVQDQQQRIDQGIRSGQLSQQEAAILRDNLDHIRGRMDRYKDNSNKMSFNERKTIKKMLDRNDRMIRKMKNNSIMRVY
jgi:hypothetical protein